MQGNSSKENTVYPFFLKLFETFEMDRLDLLFPNDPGQLENMMIRLWFFDLFFSPEHGRRHH
jgi:hypothetical protein